MNRVDVAELSVRGQVAWFELLRRTGFESWTIGEAFAVTTGLASNTDNGAVIPRSVSDVATVGEVIDWLRPRHVPASVVLAGPAEAGLVDALVGQGLVPECGGNEMGAALSDIAVVKMERAGRIDEVAELAQLRNGLDALADWYEADEVEQRLAVEARIGYGPGHPVRHWVATLDGATVGMATSFTFDDVVVLQRCGVVPEQRRNGIGSALTKARLDAARAANKRFVVTSPSPDGYELHAKSGFELVPCLPNRWFYLR